MRGSARAPMKSVELRISVHSLRVLAGEKMALEPVFMRFQATLQSNDPNRIRARVVHVADDSGSCGNFADIRTPHVQSWRLRMAGGGTQRRGNNRNLATFYMSANVSRGVSAAAIHRDFSKSSSCSTWSPSRYGG